MRLADTLGYFLLILLLLILGPVIQRYELWTGACNWTIPWLCSTIALALCIVFLASLVGGRSFSELSTAYLFSVYGAIVLVSGIGVIVDSHSFGGSGQEDFFMCVAEWLGFSFILLVLFLAPRYLKKNDNTTCGAEDPENTAAGMHTL